MAKKHKEVISKETQDEANTMAKKVKKSGQTKEQTKLVALGIQKGIAEYKKQAKAKQREADKAKKKKSAVNELNLQGETNEPKPTTPYFPWILLTLSWIGFVSYHFLNQ